MDTRINFITLYITDIVFLSLMLFGVLRWKEARMAGGIWRLMYTQVRISRPAAVTLTILDFKFDHRD